jgi:hypothetical protein
LKTFTLFRIILDVVLFVLVGWGVGIGASHIVERWKKKPATTAKNFAIGFALVGLAVGFWNANTPAPQPTAPKPPATYGASVCEDAWDKPSIDQSNFTGNSFLVPLHENCFHEVVMIPKAWHRFRWDISGSSAEGCWYAVWPSGRDASRAINCAVNVTFDRFDSVRLEGKEGTQMRIFNAEWKP